MGLAFSCLGLVEIHSLPEISLSEVLLSPPNLTCVSQPEQAPDLPTGLLQGHKTHQDRAHGVWGAPQPASRGEVSIPCAPLF